MQSFLIVFVVCLIDFMIRIFVSEKSWVAGRNHSLSRRLTIASRIFYTELRGRFFAKCAVQAASICQTATAARCGISADDRSLTPTDEAMWRA
jgi:hypothetical protein